MLEIGNFTYCYLDLVCSHLVSFAESDNPYQDDIKDIADSLKNRLLQGREEKTIQRVPLSYHVPLFSVKYPNQGNKFISLA